MHKKTFMNPVIKDSKFCSTCHKVGLPIGVTHYKDFVRGQNHYDPYLLSGVSGHGAQSFYYPDVAKSTCVECHMELKPSTDFGAKDFDGSGGREIHDHFFLGANTGLAAIKGDFEPLPPGGVRVPNTNFYRAPDFVADDLGKFGIWAADEIERVEI